MEQTRAAVNRDRKLYIQAVIEYMMKSQKSLGHTELVDEVFRQTSGRFVPSIPVVKKS